MTHFKAGQIVWHDLFTSDRERSMAFYERVANWSYQTERATDFAWGGGEKDFVLALSGDEAGAGFAETPQNQASGWIAYIEVPDVDAAVELAGALKGEIVRHPFEVPGVGRNALVRDPLGAILGISLSRHSFPLPRRQFGPELYLSDGIGFPERFYAEIFGWRVSFERDRDGGGISIIGSSGDLVGIQDPTHRPVSSSPAWVPSIKVGSLGDARRIAETNGAHQADVGIAETAQSPLIILCDPDNALFALCK